MKTFVVLLFSISLSTVLFSQEEDMILSAEEISNQPNFFLDNLEDATSPNDKGEIRLFVFRKENGEMNKEEAWVKPEMVYQLYITSTEERANEFPMEAFNFPNLQTLVFPLWKFKELPVFLPKSLPKLEYLDIQGAPVSSIPETFTDMKYLNSLNITGTKIDDTTFAKLKETYPNVTFFR